MFKADGLTYDAVVFKVQGPWSDSNAFVFTKLFSWIHFLASMTAISGVCARIVGEDKALQLFTVRKNHKLTFPYETKTSTSRRGKLTS